MKDSPDYDKAITGSLTMAATGGACVAFLVMVITALAAPIAAVPVAAVNVILTFVWSAVSLRRIKKALRG